jgi:hypothetical protein
VVLPFTIIFWPLERGRYPKTSRAPPMFYGDMGGYPSYLPHVTACSRTQTCRIITPDLPSRRTRRPALPRMPPKFATPYEPALLRWPRSAGRMAAVSSAWPQPGRGPSHISYTSPTYRDPRVTWRKSWLDRCRSACSRPPRRKIRARLKQIDHGPGRKSSSPSSRGCTERLDRHLSQRLPGSRPTYGTIRRHGFDGKCALSSTNDIGDPNRQAFRRFTRGDLTRHGASLGSRTAMITAATVRSKPSSACCSGMRST